MRSFQLTRDASQDLLAMKNYSVKQWGSDKAKEYLAELKLTMSLFAENPKIGVHWKELGEDVYYFPQGSHV